MEQHQSATAALLDPSIPLVALGGLVLSLCASCSRDTPAPSTNLPAIGSPSGSTSTAPRQALAARKMLRKDSRQIGEV
jgi:hypothetical protein